MDNVRDAGIFIIVVTLLTFGFALPASADFEQHIVSDTFGGALFHDTIDFDNDGDFDVVASGRSPGQIVWFENTNFNFSMHVIATVSNPSRVRVCDIDEDGDYDVFAAFDLSQDSYEWWENLNDGTFAHHYLDTYAYDARNLEFG
ncbi:MAG TPA: VCBS repeat-containing protein, partial [Bacteroidetes bacterium]|nr:VCBS repeat-containing protein [Bacteroidota bacterium]HEX05416.1 VCBS repeat-containing protein [Bacteroidota bacterium]